jgi:hypothetical protein
MDGPDQPLTAGVATGSAHAHEDQVAVLGAGILKSTPFERHTDRYGTVCLTVIDSIPGEPAPARTVPVPGSDLAARILQDLAKFNADLEPAAAAASEDRRIDRVVAFDTVHRPRVPAADPEDTHYEGVKDGNNRHEQAAWLAAAAITRADPGHQVGVTGKPGDVPVDGDHAAVQAERVPGVLVRPGHADTYLDHLGCRRFSRLLAAIMSTSTAP